VATGSVSLALVALAEGLAAARLFAARGGYRVETDRELIAMGAANVGAGLSGGMSVAGSLSKTAAAEQAGSRSQVSGLTSAVIVVIVLVAFTWAFNDLPRAVLSAIVVAAVWGLIDIEAVRRYARNRRLDLVAAIVAASAVLLFGPLSGLALAIAVSLLAIIYRSSRPRIEVLGKIHSEKAAWGRLRGYADREPVPGVVVVRLEGPLFWVNAVAIEDRLLAELREWPDARVLVVDLEATIELDTTTVDVLADLLDKLRRQGIDLYLARVLHSAHAVLERSGFVDALGPDHCWHSISQCVRAARRSSGLKTDGGGEQAPGPVDEGSGTGAGEHPVAGDRIELISTEHDTSDGEAPETIVHEIVHEVDEH
jgi:MFS superfamily sulfate permease-like transporter